jgi:hypothetical protein
VERKSHLDLLTRHRLPVSIYFNSKLRFLTSALIACFVFLSRAADGMTQNFSESFLQATSHPWEKDSRIAESPTLSAPSRPPRVQEWLDSNNFRRDTHERLDTDKVRPFNSRSSGVPIALIGQEGIRCVSPFRRRSNSGAAPATVGGESFSEMPLGFAVQSLGRRRTAKTREPGDLPERRHSFRRAGRAFGADFRCGDRTKCHTDGGRHG